ncbi:hypothetical protein ACC719_35460, partial [Rhizobium ruizarguesonis]
VWIDVPLDLQSAQIDPETIARPGTAPLLPTATPENISSVIGALQASKRPVVLIGSGLRSSGAEAAFRQFRNLLHRYRCSL